MVFFNLKIVDIREETLDTKTLCFKQPGLKKVKYFSGQYLTLIFRINGRRYIRPYSFSSAPGVDEYLEVTIKRVPGGIVSNHINDFVNVGDMVEVMQPMGDFIFDPEISGENKHIVLWGAGSGITPLISVAKYSLNRGICDKVTLIYGNRNEESVIFKDKINELQRLFPNTFKVWHFHTKLNISKNSTSVIEGRISSDKVHFIINNGIDLQNSVHFICGPTGLKESVKETLKSFLVSDKMIYSEDFEIVKNPEDFKDISTQFVDIVKKEQTNKVEVTKGKSILEAGLDALLDLDYSCQTGKCLVCKATILSGEVKMVGIEKPVKKLLSNECLLCCSYPLTNDVRVYV